MKFYIFRKELDGNDSIVLMNEITHNAHDLKKVIINAESKEEAKQEFIRLAAMEQEYTWMYYARPAEVYEQEKEITKGYNSYNEFLNDLYPTRPIQL